MQNMDGNCWQLEDTQSMDVIPGSDRNFNVKFLTNLTKFWRNR